MIDGVVSDKSATRRREERWRRPRRGRGDEREGSGQAHQSCSRSRCSTTPGTGVREGRAGARPAGPVARTGLGAGARPQRGAVPRMPPPNRRSASASASMRNWLPASAVRLPRACVAMTRVAAMGSRPGLLLMVWRACRFHALPKLRPAAAHDEVLRDLEAPCARQGARRTGRHRFRRHRWPSVRGGGDMAPEHEARRPNRRHDLQRAVRPCIGQHLPLAHGGRGRPIKFARLRPAAGDARRFGRHARLARRLAPTIVRHARLALSSALARARWSRPTERFDLILAMDWDNLALLENAPTPALRHKLGRLTEHCSRHEPGRARSLRGREGFPRNARSGGKTPAAAGTSRSAGKPRE